MVNKFIKMLAAYQMNNQVPPGHPDEWPPYIPHPESPAGEDPLPTDVGYPGDWVRDPHGLYDGNDPLDEVQGTIGWPEDRMNKTGTLGGHRSSPNGIKAPLPYVGPPRMDMSVQGLRAFMNTKGSTKGQLPGMGFTNLQATPMPMANSNVTNKPVTSNSLAANLMASRSAM